MTKILFTFALCAFALTASAQPSSPRKELALALAKVCVNEARWDNPQDCALIWQATRSHGSNARAQLAWLRSHSNCVLSSRPLTKTEERGNCKWTRHLTDSDERPATWPYAQAWEAYVQRWRRIRKWARAMVAGKEPVNGWPCAEDPDTWGGREIDHEQALRQGFRPLLCEGTENEGYRWPRNERAKQ